MLGLLIGAYEIGYDRGQDARARPRRPTTPSRPPAGTDHDAGGDDARPIDGARRAGRRRGKELYTSDGCAACHSLSGSAGAGPTFKGLAGSTVTLDRRLDGDRGRRLLSRVDHRARRADRQGLQPGIMSAAVSGYGFPNKPADVQSLVAFIKTQR